MVDRQKTGKQRYRTHRVGFINPRTLLVLQHELLIKDAILIGGHVEIQAKKIWVDSSVSDITVDNVAENADVAGT